MYRIRDARALDVSPARVSILLAGALLPIQAVTALPARAQLRFTEVYTVGAFDQPEEQVFGRYVTSALLRSGAIVVGDSDSGEIREFDSRGSFLRAFGRGGKGPGEFEQITSIGLNKAEDSLYVYDDANFRVSVFALDGTLARDFRPELERSGLLEMAVHPDGFLLFTGQVGESLELVHVTDPGGKHLRSFGPLLEGVRGADQPLIRRQLNQGSVCVLADGDVVVLLGAPYRIARYSLEGERRWLIEDDGLDDPLNYIEISPERYHVGLYPYAYQVHCLGDGRVAVFTLDYERERSFYDIRSARDGQRLHRRALPFDTRVTDLVGLSGEGGLSIISTADLFTRLIVSRWDLNP